METGRHESVQGSTQADTQRINDLVREAQDSQFEIERFLELHTSDVTIVNIRGMRVQGIGALRDAMAKALASPLRRVPTTVEVDDIRLVNPDVAVVSCIKHVEDERAPEERGNALPAAGRLTYVAIRRENRWLIAFAQTTPISR